MKHNTTSLPRNLRAELGLRDPYQDKKNKRNAPLSRKDRRREERSGKKTQKPNYKNARKYEEEDDDDMLDEGDDGSGLG